MLEAALIFFFTIAAYFAWRCFELNQQVTEYRIRLEEEVKRTEDKELLVASMRDSFKALAADTLQSQQTTFFNVAKSTFEKYSTDMTKPLKESLDKVDSKIHELEKTRVSAYASISEVLKNVHVETNKLARSLRSSNVRGQWGEMQLRRVVELAGMVEYCDFLTQHTVATDDGKKRPDLIIKLPNERVLVIDAKAPLQAYLEAVEAPTDDLKALKFKEHAKQVKKHLADLSDKAYWESFQHTPEFVILFLPGESFFGAALEADPQLVEFGADKKVLMATPTTLIALLRAVALGWREQVMHRETMQICELGRSLYERLATMCDHFIKLKKAIDGSVEAYNKVVGSFEGRVLPSARKFSEFKVVGSQELPILETVEKITKSLEV